MGEETPLEKVILMNIIVFMGMVVMLVMQVFKNMDKDGSGTVSKDEFLKICKNLSKEQVKAHIKTSTQAKRQRISLLSLF